MITSSAAVNVPAAVVDRVRAPMLLLMSLATVFRINRSLADWIAAKMVRLSASLSLPRSKVTSPDVDLTVPLIVTVSLPRPVDR